MMTYTDAENGKVALMQEILGVKDIQDIDLLYELHQEFMDAQKNAGTGNSEGQSELLCFFKNKKRMLINNILFFVTATGFKPVTG